MLRLLEPSLLQHGDSRTRFGHDPDEARTKRYPAPGFVQVAPNNERAPEDCERSEDKNGKDTSSLLDSPEAPSIGDRSGLPSHPFGTVNAWPSHDRSVRVVTCEVFNTLPSFSALLPYSPWDWWHCSAHGAVEHRQKPPPNALRLKRQPGQPRS
jgi:hypothetical protein